MTDDTRLRPVLALEQALGRLGTLARPGDPARGPLRQQALNAARAVPAGALDARRFDRLSGSLRAELGEGASLPARALEPPVEEVGTSWWLSSHDDLGGVLRVRLERLGPTGRPWSSFWPGGGADAAAEAAAGRAFEAAARVLGHRPLVPLRGWHRLVLAETGAIPAPRVEGGSMGAALGLMLLSAWRGTPLCTSMAVTGDLDDEGQLCLPDGARRQVEAKLIGLTRERASVRTLVVPPGFEVPSPPGGPEVIALPDLESLAAAFGLDTGPVAPATLPEWLEAIEEARWLDRVRAVSVPILGERLESLHAATRPIVRAVRPEPFAVWRARLSLLTLVCAYRAHAGDAAGAATVAAALDAGLSEEGRRPPPSLLAWSRNVEASLMIELARFEAARAYGAEALRAADDAGDLVEAAHVASTLGRIEAHAGRDTDALALLEAALERFRTAAPWESNICRCYHAGTLTRLGHFDAARAALDAAREANERAPGASDGWRRSNAVYLAYEALKLAAADPAADLGAALDTVAALADADPARAWPHAGAAARAVEACLARGDEATAHRWHRRLEALAAAHPGPVTARAIGRADAVRLAKELASDGTPSAARLDEVRTWLASLPGGAESPIEAPRAAALESLGRDAPGAARALGAVLAADVY